MIGLTIQVKPTEFETDVYWRSLAFSIYYLSTQDNLISHSYYMQNEGNAENPINLDGEGIVTEEASTSTSIDAEECSKARERQASFETEQLPTVSEVSK